MKLRLTDPDIAAAAGRIGAVADGPESGLVFEPRRQLLTWTEAEDELAEAFELTRAAASDAAPVVYLVRSSALLGRADPLDAAVATGLLGGARALAFEGRKNESFATVVAIGDGVKPQIVVEAIELLVATRGANGQTFTLGAEHLGAALP